VTGAQAYQGQSAGYYTGGSLFERNTVRNTSITNIQLPSVRAGCGGIDLFTGGFSYINSEQLVQAMKNVANNATSYAFMLAIETVSPLIAEQMKSLQDLANRINQTNINSCEMGASLVGGLWPKTDIAQKQVCESVGTSNNLFSDWAAARQGCGASGERSSTLARGKTDPRFKDMIFDNGNIAWQALQRNDFLAKDVQLSELFMSLSGTLILHKTTADDSGNSQLSYLPSLSHNNQLLKTLLQGGQASIYHCTDNGSKGCTEVTQQTITVDASHALSTRIKNMLQSIVDKIQTDAPLSNEEIGLLQATPLPLYKILNVSVAYAKGSPAIDVTEYADIVASDILYQYLTESLDVVMISSAALPLPAEMLEQFKQGVMQARETVMEERRNTHLNVNATQEIIQRIQVLEQQLAGSLSVDMPK
jgi:conjugative transfer pilus assembly protein TraH